MPFQTSQNPVMGIALADELLAALSTRPSAALLTTPTVHLYTVGPTPVLPTSTVAEFTEADFVGYSSVVLGTLLGPIILPGTDGYAVHAEADFLAGALTGSEVIAGYWIDDGATTLYYAEAFPTPIPISQTGDFISLDVIWVQPVYLTAV